MENFQQVGSCLEEIHKQRLPERRHFCLDTLRLMPLQIHQMGATFQTHIAGSVEMNVRSEMVRIYRVTDLIHGNEFVQVCTRYYTALGHLFALLAKQPYGEPGAVITDGYPLVMVKPSKRTGALFAIHVFWKKSARGWVFGACPLEEMIFGKDFCLLV